MRRRLFVLHNPNAGPAGRRRYEGVLGALRACGAQLEIVETGAHGEGGREAAAAAASGRFDAVAAAGGDGTVNDAASGLIGSSMPLGLIPTGTANVFARDLGLPTSPQRLAELLLFGKIRATPIGQIDGRPFLVVVGVGFDAEAVRHFERDGARRLGRLGLVGPVARALVSSPAAALRVTTEHGSREAGWVIVTRARRYAGGLMLAPGASVMDDRLHVVQFGGRGPLIRLRQLCAFASGLIRFDPDVIIETARQVRIEGDAKTPVHVDGELGGQLPVDVGVHPDRLQMICRNPG